MSNPHQKKRRTSTVEVEVSPKAVKTKGLLEDETNNLSSPKQVIERLKSVLAQADSLPLPFGELGCAFLDCLELTEKIREKAREMLLREPNAIPGWTATQCAPVRELDKNTIAVFEALHKADDEMTLSEFLSVCSVSLGSIAKLLGKFNPDMNEAEIQTAIDRILERLIHHRKGAVRLTRTRELPTPQPAMEIVVR